MALNLARRPFVDTRPVNTFTAVLVAAVVILSAMSWRTLAVYIGGSRGTQAAITRLGSEIARYEDQRKAGEAALARFDVEDLGFSIEDANAIARRRAFSWTRFLSRLEDVLPHEVRVVTIGLSRGDFEAKAARPARPAGGTSAAGGIPVELQLVSRDPLGLARTIRAFYASPWFDLPVPHSDEGQERAGPEGRRLSLGVQYRDAGRPVTEIPPPPAAQAKSAPPRNAGARGAAR